MRRLLLPFLLCALVAACGPKAPSPAAAKADAEAKSYLAKVAKEPGVVVLPSGLAYKVIASGPADGLRPQKGDEIKVEYTGSLVNGDVFDSTDKRGVPAVMPLLDLVPGWMEALPKMRPGDEWMLYIPPNLGYGEAGAGGVIPPNSVLVFKLKLIGVLPAPGRTAHA